MAANRGTCQDCRKRFRLTVDGDVYLHNSVEKHDGVWISDMCTGSHQKPLPDSVRAPRAERDIVEVDGHPQEATWSWWDDHAWSLWVAGLLIAGGAIGFAVGVAFGRGWRW